MESQNDSLSSINVSTSRIYSGGISSVIAALTPMLALLYFWPFYLLYQHSRRHPRAINKASGVRVQLVGPFVYLSLVFSSLAEVSVAVWLSLQYRFNDNSPGTIIRAGVDCLLFAACWTTVTSGAYALFFMDPVWSRRPIASVPIQGMWLLITWLFWAAGGGLLNAALPNLLIKGGCSGLIYCGQMRVLFALSIVNILVISFGLLVILWLAWRTVRGVLYPRYKVMNALELS